MYRSDECDNIAFAEPIDYYISVAVPGGAGKEVGFGILLALTLRAVAGNGELAKTALAFGLNFGIGSQSAGLAVILPATKNLFNIEFTFLSWFVGFRVPVVLLL